MHFYDLLFTCTQQHGLIDDKRVRGVATPWRNTGVNIGRQFVLSNARLFVHQVDLADPGVRVRCTKVSPGDGVHQMEPCAHVHWYFL